MISPSGLDIIRDRSGLGPRGKRLTMTMTMTGRGPRRCPRRRLRRCPRRGPRQQVDVRLTQDRSAEAANVNFRRALANVIGIGAQTEAFVCK